jgi:hypothetical protein
MRGFMSVASELDWASFPVQTWPDADEAAGGMTAAARVHRGAAARVSAAWPPTTRAQQLAVIGHVLALPQRADSLVGHRLHCLDCSR